MAPILIPYSAAPVLLTAFSALSASLPLLIQNQSSTPDRRRQGQLFLLLLERDLDLDRLFSNSMVGLHDPCPTTRQKLHY